MGEFFGCVIIMIDFYLEFIQNIWINKVLYRSSGFIYIVIEISLNIWINKVSYRSRGFIYIVIERSLNIRIEYCDRKLG